MKSTLAGVFLSSLVLFAGGCSDSRGDDPADAVATVAEKIERKVHDRIAVETLRLDADGSLPVAELGPDGSLVIDGRPLPMTESQRAAAMAYRTELAGIAAAGAAVGLQGAQLGLQALTEAASSLVDGDERTVEERIEAKAGAIRESAMALCDRLPAFIAAQQAFVAAVPEFAPYADANRTDLENCQVDLDPPTLGA